MYSLRQIYYFNRIDNNLKADENIDNVSIGREISELNKRLIELPKKGSEVFASQKEFEKIVNLFSTITCWK